MQAEDMTTLSIIASDESGVVSSLRPSEPQHLAKVDGIPSSASTGSDSEAEQYEPASHMDQKARRRKRRLWGAGDVASVALLHCALGNKWSLIAKHIRGRRDNDCKNIFHSALRSKTNETSALLRVYAQAVGPSCDDPRVRQAAYQAALRQAGGVEPPARVARYAAHYMEVAAEEARGGNEGGGQIKKPFRAVATGRMAASAVEASDESPPEITDRGNYTKTETHATTPATVQLSFTPAANNGPTATSTAAGSPFPTPFLTPYPTSTPNSATASVAKESSQLATASSVYGAFGAPPGKPQAASLSSSWKTLIKNTIAASPFATRMVADTGTYPLGGGGPITDMTPTRSTSLLELSMKRSASKDPSRDIAASSDYYLAGDINAPRAAAPSSAACKTAAAWPLKDVRMAACNLSAGGGSGSVRRLEHPWSFAATAAVGHMDDSAALAMVETQVVLGGEQLGGGAGCRQISPAQQQAQQGPQQFHHHPLQPVLPQQPWWGQWQQMGPADNTTGGSMSGSPDLALRELDIAMAEAEGGSTCGLGDGDGGGGWGTWLRPAAQTKHGLLVDAGGYSKPPLGCCSRPPTARQLDPVEEIFPNMESVKWRTPSGGIGIHDLDPAFLRAPARAGGGYGGYDVALMRIGEDAGGFEVAPETGMGPYGRQYEGWRCCPQPLFEGHATDGAGGPTAATLLLDGGVGVPTAAGDREGQGMAEEGSSVLSSVGSAAAGSSTFWNSRLLNTSVDLQPSAAPNNQPVWNWSRSPAADAFTAARAAMASAASVKTSQLHQQQPLQLQQPQPHLQRAQRPNLMESQRSHEQELLRPVANVQQQQPQFRSASAARYYWPQQPAKSEGPIWTAFSPSASEPMHHTQHQKQYTKTQQQLRTRQQQIGKEVLLRNARNVSFGSSLRKLGQQGLDVDYCHLLAPGESLDDLMMDLLGQVPSYELCDRACMGSS